MDLFAAEKGLLWKQSMDPASLLHKPRRMTGLPTERDRRCLRSTPAGVQFEFDRPATGYLCAVGGKSISVPADTMKRPHQIQPLRGWQIIGRIQFPWVGPSADGPTHGYSG